MKDQKMMTGILYKVDGSLKTIVFNQENCLELLQSLVGGLIDVVHIEREGEKKGVDLIINDEGGINGMPPNPWSKYVGRSSVWQNQKFFGDILLLDGCLP